MKKIRNLLIWTLIAAMSLSVFIGCDSETNPPGKTVGDLVITKYMLPPSKADYDPNPEGIKMDGNFKFIAVTNISDKTINLENYGIAYTKDNDDKYPTAEKFPKTTIAPNATLYILNNWGLDIIRDMLPNMNTIPEAKEGEPILSDAYISIAARHSDKTKTILAKDIVINESGETNADIYTWIAIDEVLLDGKIPARDSLLIRSFDANTRIDNGWEKLDWKDPATYAKLDAKKGDYKPDYSYDTLKPSLNTLAGTTTSLIYSKMSETELAAFKEASKTEIHDVFIEDSTFYIEKTEGVFLYQKSGGKWYEADFSVKSFTDSVKAEELAVENPENLSKTRYCYMPAHYVDTFVTAINGNEGWIFTPGKTITFELNGKKFIQNDNGSWSYDNPIDVEKVSNLRFASAYTRGNTKIISIKNTSKDTAVSLAGLNIIFDKYSGTSDQTDAFTALPNITLKADSTIFIVHADVLIADQGTEKNEARFPGILGLPEVTKASSGEFGDCRYQFNLDFNGEDNIQLVYDLDKTVKTKYTGKMIDNVETKDANAQNNKYLPENSGILRTFNTDGTCTWGDVLKAGKSPIYGKPEIAKQFDYQAPVTP